MNIGDAKLVGSSDLMVRLSEQIDRMAKIDETLLIHGEQGSGKQLVASSIHNSSSRASNGFRTVQCGVISSGMLEVELFGHVADAFVGAGSPKKGLLEECSGGTVLLAGAEQIQTSTQVKILSFINTGEFRAFGSDHDKSNNTRLLFATSEDMRKLTLSGVIREDFFYKISMLHIAVPPLRDHKEDIPEIADFIIQNSKNSASREKKLARKATEALMKYNWPSNVRELAAVIEQATILSEKGQIQIRDLPESFEKKAKENWQHRLLSLSDVEKEHIFRVLDAVNGNISKASRILGISRPKLYRKLEIYSTKKRL